MTWGLTKFCRWLLEQKKLLLTDTTFRDAHQSLLATRMRTFDMLRIAPVYAQRHADLFSLEMWGGATFDTALRFLKEDPWQRLLQMRERIPNILFQMLLRANNAVGYTNYPDNVVKAFIKETAQAGIDRGPHLRRPQLAAQPEAGHRDRPPSGNALRTGHLLHGRYSRSAQDEIQPQVLCGLWPRNWRRWGPTCSAIKDMAGLCKPYAAKLLVRTLKEEIGIPVHFHTHDSAGGQIASLLAAAEEGVDVVDVAMGPLAGMTSQPSLNTLVECLRFQERDTGLDFDNLQATADYWQGVRRFYDAFESGQLAKSAERLSP